MVHIALVEDDLICQNEMLGYLKQYEQESNEKFHISVFHDGNEIAEDYKAHYDIILMDIEMRIMDGMTAAERIRNLDSEVVIIFITNMPQYAMEGYKVDALDYVLKPVSYYAFSQRIDRALSRMERRKKKYLTIAIKGGLKKLDISLITYIEVQDHELVYHTKEEEFKTKGSLSYIEKELKDMGFFRCNKCYLVNMEYVEMVQNNDALVGGVWIQVSRSKKKLLMDALNNYMNEVSK